MQIDQSLPPSSSPYTYQHLPNTPKSLTMTKIPQNLLTQICHPITYIWLDQDHSKRASQIKQIEENAEVRFVCCGSVEEVKVEVGKVGNVEVGMEVGVVVVCQGKFLEDLDKEFGNVGRVYQVICYPADEEYFQRLKKDKRIGQKFQFLPPNPTLLTTHLIQNTRYHLHQKHLPNFISLKSEVWDSTTLMKTMIVMLKQETNRKMLIEELVTVAKKLPRCNLDDIEEFVKDAGDGDGMTCDRAVRWYTYQKFLFGLVNGLLRSGRHPAEVFCLQPYFKDLFNAIKQLYHVQSPNKPHQEFTCYRGGLITPKQLQSLKSNINGIVQNLGFMSTSINKNTPSQYIVNAYFIVHVKDGKRDQNFDHGYAFVQEFSAYSYEEEVLFNPLNSYRVERVQKVNKNGRQYYEIELIYGQLARIMSTESVQLSPEQQDIKDIGQYQLQQNKQLFCEGQVLVQNKVNLKGSQQYWTKYVEIDKDDLSTIGLQMLAATNMNKNKFRDILKFQQECLDRTRNTMGENSIQYASSLNRIGLFYRYKQQFEKSLEFYQKSRQIFWQNGGQTNVEYFDLLVNIGQIYDLQGKYKQSLQTFSSCYERMKNFFGQKHPKCAPVLLRIGFAKYRIGQFKQSLQIYQKVQEIRKKILGENHPEYVIIISLMGFIYVQLCQYETALNLYEKVREVRLQNLGRNHFDYSQILYKIGQVYFLLQNYQKAEQLFKEASEIMKDVLGQNSIQYANILNNVSGIYIKKNLYQEAASIIQKALKIYSQTVGQFHPFYSNALNNLAAIYTQQGLYAKAQDLFKKCSQNFKNTFGQEDIQYGKMIANLGEVQARQGNYQQSLILYKKSLQIFQNKLVKNHPDYLQVKRLMQESEQKLSEKMKLSSNPQLNP